MSDDVNNAGDAEFDDLRQLFRDYIEVVDQAVNAAMSPEETAAGLEKVLNNPRYGAWDGVSDFYEEDEPLESLLLITSRAPDGLTTPPTRGPVRLLNAAGVAALRGITRQSVSKQLRLGKLPPPVAVLNEGELLWLPSQFGTSGGDLTDDGSAS